MLAQGHEVVLYAYDQLAGIPDGITIADAAAILPPDRIIHHHSGSVSLFSNHFRYELMRRGLGTWVDADTYLFAPLPGDSPYLMGWHEEKIATGVLRLPDNCPMLPPLLDLFRQKRVPSWMPWQERAKAWVRLLTSGSANLGQMPWGVAGPRAVTALAKRHGLDRFACPQDVLYPWTWRDTLWIVDPSQKLEDRISERTIAASLFNSLLSELKDRPAPAGSFLARLQREGE